jgi:beta-lactamase class C
MHLPALASLVVLGLITPLSLTAAPPNEAQLKQRVDTTIAALMKEQSIPGMAIGILADGKQHFFYYGNAAPDGGPTVSKDTLFELGSVSKTYTAAFAAHAQATKRLSLSDPASRHMPELAKSPIGSTTLDQLGTYIAGGLPLQVPEEVETPQQLISYFQNWKPSFPAGSMRLYSNPSIGLLGLLAAKSQQNDFAKLVSENMLPALGLADTFIHVPDNRMNDYAWGVRDGRRIRVTPGALDAQAYGIKTTASDLLRFVQRHMGTDRLPPEWKAALANTRQPRYRVGPMMQCLGWDSYVYPTTLEDMLAGNSTDMALKPNAIKPLGPLPKVMLFNKTGSTNGFGAYALFIPSRRIGIVMLANRYYPNPERIKAAWAILRELER